MTPTREELELVAKVAGYEVEFQGDHCVFKQMVGNASFRSYRSWLPASDPGDSRRLQVALNINLIHWHGEWYADAPGIEKNSICEDEADHPTPDIAACVAVFRCALAVAKEGRNANRT